jgi:hypothetical protein
MDLLKIKLIPTEQELQQCFDFGVEFCEILKWENDRNHHELTLN